MGFWTHAKSGIRKSILPVLAVLCLLLSIGLVALWIRSYSGSDSAIVARFLNNRVRSVTGYSGPGQLGLAFVHALDHRPDADDHPGPFAYDTWMFATERLTDKPYIPEAPGGWNLGQFHLHFGDDTRGWR